MRLRRHRNCARIAVPEPNGPSAVVEESLEPGREAAAELIDHRVHYVLIVAVEERLQAVDKSLRDSYDVVSLGGGVVLRLLFSIKGSRCP